MLQFLGNVGAIILVDLALSGDNALIIGAAAAGLAPRQRTLAIIAGGGAAIVLRVALAIAATLLLQITLLQAIGGAILIVIAVRLLLSRSEDVHDVEASGAAGSEASQQPRMSFATAILTILVADVTMSLDNILAVGGLAHGDLLVLGIGLLVSVAILLVGSAIVAGLMGRLPWLLDLAALVLGWTAGTMIYHDQVVGPYFYGVPFAPYTIPVAGALVVLVIDLVFQLRSRRAHARATATPMRDSGERVKSQQ
jgi:YjbE family integral membrane protein